MSQNTNLVSIIIPLYNKAEYISSCLQSLGVIPECECEIIVVNDGSTDFSLDVVNDWALKLQNLKIINTENGGVSRARNIGMENASGKYILFVDADDKLRFDKNFKTIGELLSDKYLNLINMKCNWKDGENYLSDISLKNNTFDINHFLRLEAEAVNSCCNKFFLRERVLKNGIVFFEGCHVAEDLNFTLKYLAVSTESIKLLPYIEYEYARNELSVSSRVFSNMGEVVEKLKIFALMVEDASDFSETINSPNLVAVNYFFSTQYIKIYRIFFAAALSRPMMDLNFYKKSALNFRQKNMLRNLVLQAAVIVLFFTLLVRGIFFGKKDKY